MATAFEQSEGDPLYERLMLALVRRGYGRQATAKMGPAVGA
jgi:hypothetical protein